MDGNLSARLNDLKTGADTATKARTTATAEKWFGPNNGQPFLQDDNQTIISAFKRNNLEQAFLKAIKPDGKSADAQSLKLQSDMLAAMEREVRMRYRSRVRMFAHATARLKSAGEQGGIFDTIGRQQFSREGQA